MMNQNKDSFYYFLSISVGTTAYQVFSKGMGNLNWTYSGFLFSIIRWLSIKFLYLPTEKILNNLRKDNQKQKTKR